jgi:hypothetical protein
MGSKENYQALAIGNIEGIRARVMYILTWEHETSP